MTPWSKPKFALTATCPARAFETGFQIRAILERKNLGASSVAFVLGCHP